MASKKILCDICGQPEPHSTETCELSMGFPFTTIEPEKCQACGLLSVVNETCIECGAKHTLASPKDHPNAQ